MMANAVWEREKEKKALAVFYARVHPAGFIVDQISPGWICLSWISYAGAPLYFNLFFAKIKIEISDFDHVV